MITTIARVTLMNAKMTISTQSSPNVAVFAGAFADEEFVTNEPKLTVTSCEL